MSAAESPAASPATSTAPVAVIGAGIVGVATAIWLQRAGQRVVLIDREGPAAGASYGNAGMLASASILPVTVPGLLAKAPKMLFDPNQPLFLRWPYVPRLAPWLVRYLARANTRDMEATAAAIHGLVSDALGEHRALAEGTGAEGWIQPTDYVFVYKDEAAFRGDAKVWALRRRYGMEWTERGGAALAAYEPLLGAGYAAAVPGHGRITDPGAYVKALAAHFERQGGEIRIGTVTDIRREGGRVTGLRLGGETLDCAHAVLTAGAWSGPLCRALGLKVPLESERGYHIELWEPSAMPRNSLMMTAGKFVVTPMEGRLRLAGVVEFGGLEAGPSRAPFELLKRNLAQMMPGLSWKHMTEWMGHRPAPADSIPALGEVPGARGMWLGFGHHHIGLTAGARTGRLLAQLIGGQRPNLDLAPYAPARFV